MIFITIFENEMEKLEKQQRELHDNHNTKEREEWRGEQYVNQLRASSKLLYAINPNEDFENYMIRLQTHVDMQTKKNADTHIWNNGRGCWFTHEDKFGKGCFMCEDVNLVSYMSQLLWYFAHKYPQERIDL